MLARHVHSDKILQDARDHPHLDILAKAGHQGFESHANIFAGKYETEGTPKYRIPEEGVSEEAAYHLLTSELTLDGNPTLNLASFVHTGLPDWGARLCDERKYINIVDQDEYPASLAIHGRCISQLAALWHAPEEKDANGEYKQAFGTATTGSSEAIMLAGLAMKKRWQKKRQEQGKPWKGLGNIVFGSNAQVAIEKFARYFDLEERLVPTSKESHYRMDPKKAIEMVDEETIGVIVILGSTYTGHYEPVEETSKLLDDLQSRTGLDIPIHVDGASGAMVAPFAHPSLKWDFTIPRVVSINTSGHKFGMTQVGLGWVVFRSPDVVPKELVFELHYLGSVEYSFGLNFSRPAAPILVQAWRFLSLGFNGYKAVMENDLKNARLLSRALELSGKYEVLSDIHRPRSLLASAATKSGVVADEESGEYYEAGLPVVAFRWSEDFRKRHPHLQQSWIQTLLRVKGYIVPNYSLSPDCESIEVLRVVIRETQTSDLTAMLFSEIMTITEDLEKRDSPSAALAHVEEQSKAQEEKHAREGKGHSSKQFFGKHAHRPHGHGVQATGYSKQC
ncbi:unnamed protein product [Parajaminaea phylloscopi]